MQYRGILLAPSAIPFVICSILAALLGWLAKILCLEDVLRLRVEPSHNTYQRRNSPVSYSLFAWMIPAVDYISDTCSDAGHDHGGEW